MPSISIKTQLHCSTDTLTQDFTTSLKILLMWLAIFKMTHKDLCPLVFISLYNSSTWMWTINSDLLLMNRIWQKWWSITFMIRLQKASGFLLAHHLLLVHSGKAADIFQIALWRSPHDKEPQEACSQQLMGTRGSQYNSPQIELTPWP